AIATRCSNDFAPPGRTLSRSRWTSFTACVTAPSATRLATCCGSSNPGPAAHRVATTTVRQPPALHVADSHDLIRVHGARENNLKDVSVEIPKRRLTVFTGVSGSGKSSLVFSTIAAESQRLINETYSTFVQGFMPTLSRPEV